MIICFNQMGFSHFSESQKRFSQISTPCTWILGLNGELSQSQPHRPLLGMVTIFGKLPWKLPYVSAIVWPNLKKEMVHPMA